MSTFVVLLLCIQACLVQNVLSQCSTTAGLIATPLAATYGPAACGAAYVPATAAYAPTSIAYGPTAAACSPATAYGGTGEGNVFVIGELPIAGNTAVTGQVPITGIVHFGGALPAAGAVSIAGNCNCGCGSGYAY